MEGIRVRLNDGYGTRRMIVATAIAAMMVLPGAVADASTEGQEERVTICHSAGQSGTWTTNTVPVSAIKQNNGHYYHQGGRDIIPPFTYHGETFSLNWDATGQAIYANGCAIPAPSPTPTPTVVVPPSPTPTPTVVVPPSPTPTPTVVVPPSPTPTPSPTVEVTPTPTPSPTVEVTPSPTAVVTPTDEPTDEPTAVVTPTDEPTDEPTAVVTPTDEPTAEPTEEPAVVVAPTQAPAEPTTIASDPATGSVEVVALPSTGTGVTVGEVVKWFVMASAAFTTAVIAAGVGIANHRNRR